MRQSGSILQDLISNHASQYDIARRILNSDDNLDIKVVSMTLFDWAIHKRYDAVLLAYIARKFQGTGQIEMKLFEILKEKIIHETNISEAELGKILSTHQPSRLLQCHDDAIKVMRELRNTSREDDMQLIIKALKLYVVPAPNDRTKEEEKRLKRVDNLVYCHDTILDKNSRRRSNDYDMTINVLLIGDAGVGKHNLISRYAKNIYGQWPSPVFEYFFEHKYCTIDDSKIILNFCHHSSMEKSHSHRKPSRFNVMIFCYDVTDKTSFSSIAQWVYKTNDYVAQHTLKILVGLKNDNPNKKVVYPEEPKEFADKNGMIFFEASAKHDLCIDEMFEYAIKHQLERAIKNERGEVSFQANPKEEIVTPIPAQPTLQDTQPINIWTSSTALTTGTLVIAVAAAIFFDIGGIRSMCTKIIEKLYGTSHEEIMHGK